MADATRRAVYGARRSLSFEWGGYPRLRETRRCRRCVGGHISSSISHTTTRRYGCPPVPHDKSNSNYPVPCGIIMSTKDSDTCSQMSSAPWHHIPQENYIGVEHPGVIRNIDKAIASLGGEQRLGEVITMKPSITDFYTDHKTSSYILKIRKRLLDYFCTQRMLFADQSCPASPRRQILL